MNQEEFKKLIKELVIEESFGRAITNTLEELLSDANELFERGTITDNERKEMKKAIYSLVKVYKKVLKNKGLIGW